MSCSRFYEIRLAPWWYVGTKKLSYNYHILYDSHFIMQEVGKFKQAINVIPNNM